MQKVQITNSNMKEIVMKSKSQIRKEINTLYGQIEKKIDYLDFKYIPFPKIKWMDENIMTMNKAASYLSFVPTNEKDKKILYSILKLEQRNKLAGISSIPASEISLHYTNIKCLTKINRMYAYIHELAHHFRIQSNKYPYKKMKSTNSQHDKCFKQTEQYLFSLFGYEVVRKKGEKSPYKLTLYKNGKARFKIYTKKNSKLYIAATLCKKW